MKESLRTILSLVLGAGLLSMALWARSDDASASSRPSLQARWETLKVQRPGAVGLRGEAASYVVRFGWFQRGEMTTSMKPAEFEGRPVWHARRRLTFGWRLQEEQARFTREGLLPLHYKRVIALDRSRRRVDELYWDHLAGELSLEERIEEDGKVVQVKSREVWTLGRKLPSDTGDPLCLWWRCRSELSRDSGADLATNGVAVVSVDDVYDWKLKVTKGKRGLAEVDERYDPREAGQPAIAQQLTLDPSRRWLPQSGRARLWGRDATLKLESVRQDAEEMEASRL